MPFKIHFPRAIVFPTHVRVSWAGGAVNAYAAVRAWDIESGNPVVRFDAFPGLSRPSGNRP